MSTLVFIYLSHTSFLSFTVIVSLMYFLFKAIPTLLSHTSHKCYVHYWTETHTSPGHNNLQLFSNMM
jgi:hypothetical protein